MKPKEEVCPELECGDIELKENYVLNATKVLA